MKVEIFPHVRNTLYYLKFHRTLFLAFVGGKDFGLFLNFETFFEGLEGVFEQVDSFFARLKGVLVIFELAIYCGVLEMVFDQSNNFIHKIMGTIRN